MTPQNLRSGDRVGCPPLESFVHWQNGQLLEAQVQALSHHLEACTDCLHTLESLVVADPLAAHLRQGVLPVSAGEKAEVDSLLLRLQPLVVTPNPTSGETQIVSPALDFAFLSRPEAADEIGRLGDYRVLRLLGQGGMGLVFLAEDLQLRRSVALKVLRREAELKPGARERFLREARAAAAVRHDHVVTIYRVGEVNNVPYLAMDLLQGETLETRCKNGPPLSLTDIVRFGREVAEGLAAAHDQGLTHRDIKPDNIWLEAIADCGLRIADSRRNPQSAIRNPQSRVKLLDFGLARAAQGDAQITQDGMIVGTPAYMAPEQASGAVVDGRSDLFSLGCVLYRLAAGQPPFRGPNALAVLNALANDTPPPLRQLNPEIPESLSRLVVALLARRPDDRPPSARAVVEELAAVEREVTARGNDGLTARRSILPTLLVLLAAAGLLALGVWAATVLRLQTEEGEIVVQTNDPKVAVLFEQGKVQVHDRKSGKKYTLALGAQKQPSGEYEFTVTDEDAGLNFTTREFVLKRGEPVVVQVSFRPKQPAAQPIERGPADALKRGDIAEELLVRAGGGDRSKAPPELVGVLGGARHFRVEGAHRHHLYTRFSPDGRFLVALSNKDVLVHDVATGRLVWRLTHEKPGVWFDFRPDHKALAVGSDPGVDLWDLSTGKSLGRLTAGAPVALAYTADGQGLVTTDADGKARLWNVASKQLVRTFDPPEGHRFVQAPQIQPKGSLVALHASGAKPVVRVLELTTGEQKTELPGTGEVGVSGREYQTSVRFSPDGRLLACVRNSASVVLWEVATWTAAGTLEGTASILNFSADSSTLFRGHVTNDRGIKVVLNDAKTQARKAELALPIVGGVSWSDLSPDGRTIVVRRVSCNCLALFDAATGAERFPLVGHRFLVNAVAVSPDGRLVASSGTDHRVLLWDLGSGTVLRELTFVPGSYQAPYAVTFSADGKWVAAAGMETSAFGWFWVWETATGKEVRLIPGKGTNWQRSSLAFHPKTGSLVVTERTRLESWNLKDASKSTWEPGHGQAIESVSFDATGQRLATGDKAGVVCVQDASQQQLHKFRCDGPVSRVQFSPDGQQLAATTWAPDRALYLWDLKTGTRTRRVGHADSVSGLAWHPDSQLLATTSFDGTIRLWPRDLGLEARTLRLHAGAQGQPAFTPDGRHLLTANQDGSIHVLRLAEAP